MTIFTQEERRPRGRSVWRAWLDSKASVAGSGRSRCEAVGALVVLVAELNPGPVVLIDRPAVEAEAVELQLVGAEGGAPC